MKKVIIDSNFFFIPSQFRLDIFDELTNLMSQNIDLVILSTTHEELLHLAERTCNKIRQQATLALKLADKCRLVHVTKDFNETNDDVIVRMAKAWKCPVATNDRALRKALRRLGIPVIYLRQKHLLELEGAV